VSKKQPAEAIRAAHAAGQRAFGESYLQEALDKQALLADLSDIEWHFIGRIQANKTRQIAAHFDWVHGLADAAHARRLSEQRPATVRP
jgi:PLP dependent protein